MKVQTYLEELCAELGPGADVGAELAQGQLGEAQQLVAGRVVHGLLHEAQRDAQADALQQLVVDQGAQQNGCDA